MKKLAVILTALIFGVANIYSQGLYNQGAKIVISSGTYLYIDGGSNGDFTNADDGTNIGEVDLDGTMIIEGDLINNGSSNVFTNIEATPDGTVRFPSGTHTITANTTNSDGVITNYVDFEKVEIPSGSTVNVPSGSGITINGDLTLDGNLHLLEGSNPEDATGSLIIQNTTYSGSGQVHLHRTFKIASRWQYISMPVNNATDDLFDHSPSTGNFNPNLYWYDETYDATSDPSNTNYSNWESTTYQFYQAWYNAQVASQSASNPLEVGKGYITYNEANITNTFSVTASQLNLANSYNLGSYMSFTQNDGNSDYYDGWNLLGNPYQSAIDWESVTRTNVKSTVYLWDGDAGNYIYYSISGDVDQGSGQTLNSDNTARYIPEFQAFFVKANGSSPSLTIPKSACTHAANPMKSADNLSNKPLYDYFKLRIEYQHMSDEAMVRFIDNATWGDDDYDAPKAFALWNSVPQIYSLTSTYPTAIPYAFNSVPNDLDLDFVSIPLGIVAKENGDYQIFLKDYNNFNFDKVYLIDKIDDDNVVYTDLLKNGTYNIYLEAGEYRNRFFLLGVYSNGSDPITNDDDDDVTNILYGEGNGVNIYSSGNVVYLSIPNIAELNGQVEIYDEVGRKIYQGKAHSSLTEIRLNVPTGTYIVKYKAPNKIYTEKVILSL